MVLEIERGSESSDANLFASSILSISSSQDKRVPSGISKLAAISKS